MIWPHISNLTVHTVILPSMNLWWWVKNKIGINSDHSHERFFLLVTNRYVAIMVIIGLTLGVTVSNVIASDNYDEYGQNVVMYKLVGKSDISLIEDSSVTQEVANTYRYHESPDLAYSGSFTESQRREDETSRDQDGSITNLDGSTVMKPDLTGTESNGSGRAGITSYVVADGDSIGKIASSFSLSVNTLLWANNLTFNSYIKPGQSLTIPPVNGVIHKVGSGDTLAKLAQRYEADEQKIRDFNRLDETGKLAVGEMVMVPGGRVIDTVKPRTSSSRFASTPGGRSSTVKVDSKNIVSSGRMLWPNSCRRISQSFRGWVHTGIDIACPWGVPIFAADDGVVSSVIYGRTGYGYHVIIKHANGIETLYAHLSSISVTPGQRVSKGSTIGLEGSTGRSTGPHLHFEVRVGGARVNPLNYVR